MSGGLPLSRASLTESGIHISSHVRTGESQWTSQLQTGLAARTSAAVATSESVTSRLACSARSATSSAGLSQPGRAIAVGVGTHSSPRRWCRASLDAKARTRRATIKQSDQPVDDATGSR